MFMNWFQILASCTSDFSNCCSDYGLAVFLHIFKTVMSLIQIIVPIVLIVMCAIDFSKLVINPDDNNKAKSKGLLNKFLAAVIVFLMPIIVNAIIGTMVDSFDGAKGFDVISCWDAADEIWSKTQKK